jgi:regulator of protease activity HflC (stomatin/prohibitin superfamily)
MRKERNMRKIMLFGFVLLALFTLIGCTKVEQGYVGLRVNLMGTDKGGVEILAPGMYGTFLQFNVDYLTYPVFVKQYPFTQAKTEGSPSDEAMYFQSKDGVECNVDVAVSGYTDATKADVIYRTYRKDLEQILHTNVRQYLRDRFVEYASVMTVDDLYSNKKVELINNIKKDTIARFAPEGLVIVDVSFLGNVRFPAAITSAIEAKYAQVQVNLQREAQVAQARADAEIKIANARGDAESAKLRSVTITQNIIDMEKLTVEKAWIVKWDGKLPVVQGGSSITDARSLMQSTLEVVSPTKK